MPTLAEAARLLWCPGLAQVASNPSHGVQHWLEEAHFAPREAGGNVILYGVQWGDYLRSLAFDINRTLTAASETLLNISAVHALPKSLGWPYIKLYYAALYSAHAIQRMWGRSPSWITTKTLLPLRNLVRAYALTPSYGLSTGQYTLQTRPAGSEVELTQDGGSGGSHDAIWRGLGASLEELRVAVAASNFVAPERASLQQELSAALSLMTNNGGHAAWLSSMRNDIQYRQAEGVWYPYAGKLKSERLVQYAAVILNDDVSLGNTLSISGTPLQRFEAACIFIIVLARNIAHDMRDIGGPKSYLVYGADRFEAAFVDA